MSKFVATAVRLELHQRSLEETAALKEERNALAAQVAFYEARAGENSAETLRELQHAYNLVAVLVDQMGGKVSVKSDDVFNRSDSQLRVEQPEEGEDAGNIVLSIKPAGF